MKQCSHCKKYKDSSEFGHSQRCRDGLRSWCKQCARKYYKRKKEELQFIDGKEAKTCRKCGKLKLLDDFYRHKKGRFGRLSTCKECLGVSYKNSSKIPIFDNLGRAIKKCRRCGELKLLTAFGKSVRDRDGLSIWCRECMNEHKRQVRRKESK